MQHLDHNPRASALLCKQKRNNTRVLNFAPFWYISIVAIATIQLVDACPRLPKISSQCHLPEMKWNAWHDTSIARNKAWCPVTSLPFDKEGKRRSDNALEGMRPTFYIASIRDPHRPCYFFASDRAEAQQPTPHRSLDVLWTLRAHFAKWHARSACIFPFRPAEPPPLLSVASSRWIRYKKNYSRETGLLWDHQILENPLSM